MLKSYFCMHFQSRYGRLKPLHSFWYIMIASFGVRNFAQSLSVPPRHCKLLSYAVFVWSSLSRRCETNLTLRDGLTLCPIRFVERH
jgi:hypothetical protein